MKIVVPILALLAIVGAALAVPHHIIRHDFGYFEWQNGEFLNYALFASARSGVNLPEYVLPYVAKHAEMRSGVDYVNVLVSQIAGVPPVHSVDIASALLRGLYLMVLFVFAFFVGEKYRASRWLTVLVCAAFAVYPLDVWHFQISFMSANLALTLGILMIAVAYAADRMSTWAVAGSLALLNIAFLMTYPEAFIVFKAAFIAVALSRRQTWKPLLYGELASVVVAPLLFWRKAAVMLSQANSGGGWNILGEPLKGTGEYLGHIFGLKFLFAPTFGVLQSMAVLTVAAAGTLALYFFAWRRSREHALWIIPACLVAFHLIGYRSGLYYPAAKFITWTAWTIVPVTIIALSRVRYAGALVGLAIACWLVVDIRAFKEQEAKGTFYSNAAAVKVADEIRAAGSPRIVINGPDGLYAPIYWFEYLTAEGLQVAPKDEHQARNFGRADYFWKLDVNAKPYLLRTGEQVIVLETIKAP